ncbi:hypothetical protein BZG36_00104 [Bifiguratus adelaidae]|uniref:Uncharacterized protein n=1 Tax=Bifiguratus adelaidae TaxID=1938954 RepID=A0A261Y8J7_9FUNG|nr:hypothetical protein BZG36_00104 [Bifiguratus adelaidae]
MERFYSLHTKQGPVHCSCSWRGACQLDNPPPPPDTNEPICFLTLLQRTTFWSLTVTGKHVASMLSSQIDPETHWKFIRSALDGQRECADCMIDYDLSEHGSQLRLTWRTTIQGLKIKVGSVDLSQISQNEQEHTLSDWIETLIKDRNTLEGNFAVIKDRLIETMSSREALEQQMTEMINEKQDAEREMMIKASRARLPG